MSHALNLKERALMFSCVRDFFSRRNVLEVDTPILSKTAPIDAHIDVMEIPGTGYLHTSPEYALKRLLSMGSGDIYQMSHVFRLEEQGRLHNPEFTLVEWYRLGFSYKQMIDETVDFVRLFLGDLPLTTLTYREAFHKYTDIDYSNASLPEYPAWDHDTTLQYLMGFVIEPQLQSLTVITDFPASQSALAQITNRNDEPVAERFEIYYKGIELANGFHELADAGEQRRRLEEANKKRKLLNKNELPIDEDFLAALEHGLPDCCGVAVGFDRLMLLKQKAQSLSEVIPFAWHSSATPVRSDIRGQRGTPS